MKMSDMMQANFINNCKDIFIYFGNITQVQLMKDEDKEGMTKALMDIAIKRVKQASEGFENGK